MMRTLLIFALSVSGLSGMASAQPSGSLQPRVATPGSQLREDVAQSDKLFRQAITCVATEELYRVKSLLATAPGSKDEKRLITSVKSAIDYCILGPQDVRYSESLLRGGFAEVLYHKAFPGGFAPSAPAEGATAWAEPWLNRGGDQSLELLHSAARCLVVGHPARVRDLLETQPLSAAETQAMGEVQKLLVPCLFSGITLTSNQQSLRGLLAEAALGYGIGQRDGFRAPKGIAARN